MARGDGSGPNIGGGSVKGKSTQLQKILDWAESKRGSTEYHGYCQKFVYWAVTAGIGEHESSSTAAQARSKWMKKNTAGDMNPPAGAAVYFRGTGLAYNKAGHVALSAGNGYIYDPVITIVKHKFGKYDNGGYLGWGWEGGKIPDGARTSAGLSGSSDSGINIGVNSYGNGTYSSSENSKSETVEISSVVVKNESGNIGRKNSSGIISAESSDDIFLLIQGDDKIYRPLVTDEIKVTRERTGAPGKMTFSYVDIEGMKISEGSAVAFRYKNKKIFYGYIFILERDSEREKVSVTCYDQLRYFKNKDSFVYNKKYSDLVKFICNKYKLKTGTIEDTSYVIPERLEDGSLFDICTNAAGFTRLSNGKTFALYDDFGAICLKNIENMMLKILIDKDVTGGWKLKESIDSDVYNRIVVRKDNNQTGERELYIANDSTTQQKWGVLAYEDDAGESGASALKARAEALLKYYNRPNKTFSVSNCLGHTDVRGGSSMIVAFDLGNGDKIQNLMIVNKVEHTFSDGGHFMDMNLYGGAFNA